MSPPLDLKRYPVLYVDDEPNNLLVFATVFGDAFQVFTARTPEAAFAILDAEPVALALFDQRMPGITGIALAERVRARHPSVERMIVTAYSDTAEAVEAINRGGVSQWIRKPWEAEEVGAILRASLERRALQDLVHGLQSKMLQTERLALLGVATASVAHDLRSPLAVLRSGLGFVHERLTLGGDLDREALLSLVVELQGACEQMIGLVRTVGMHAQSPQPRHERLQLSEIVESILPLCRVEIERRAVLRVELGQAPAILGDPVRLGQVVLNLLVNAGQAIGPGKRSENEVKLVLRDEGGQACIEVHDTGEGIPEGQLQTIFEPFFTTRGAQGTGLGLAIVRQALEAHGGTVVAESTLGRGTVFRVCLPAAGAAD